MLLSDYLREQGTYISMDCGGQGFCGKCGVLVNGEFKLACKTDISELSKDFKVSAVQRQDIVHVIEQPMFPEYVIAIDIGTTTVAALLADSSGGVIKRVMKTNSTRVFGADILSRINMCEKFSDTICEMLRADVLCCVNALTGTCVKKIMACGNTAVLSMFLNKNTYSLGKYPFDYDESLKSFNDVKIGGNTVTTAPCFGAFIGADSLFGALYCFSEYDIYCNKIYIDIGTNCEILLQEGGKVYAASTPAGPAFEGGNISCGMPYGDGAVTDIKYNLYQGFTLTSVGNEEPRGLCGSAVFSLMPILSLYFAKDGVLAEDVQLNDNITFTKEDFYNVLLAKAALRAGIDALTQDIAVDKVYIAGNFLWNDEKDTVLENIFAVGILPRSFRDKVTIVGNASIASALSMAMGKRYQSEMTEITLAKNQVFCENFIKHITI
ncbi:hypothetical protein AGMMS49975_13270 [Clostridia bacterium]|nr:hypothetical protein AGMMS49975_13270 [Clostridia bacterium]